MNKKTVMTAMTNKTNNADTKPLARIAAQMNNNRTQDEQGHGQGQGQGHGHIRHRVGLVETLAKVQGRGRGGMQGEERYIAIGQYAGDTKSIGTFQSYLEALKWVDKMQRAGATEEAGFDWVVMQMESLVRGEIQVLEQIELERGKYRAANGRVIGETRADRTDQAQADQARSDQAQKSA